MRFELMHLSIVVFYVFEKLKTTALDHSAKVA